MVEKCDIPTEPASPGPWKFEPAGSGFRAPCDDGAADFQIVAADGACPGIVWEFGKIGEANARLIAAAPDLLAALKEMGDWIAAGLQASDEAWPDARCLQHTEEIAARARAAVDKAEGRS